MAAGRPARPCSPCDGGGRLRRAGRGGADAQPGAQPIARHRLARRGAQPAVGARPRRGVAAPHARQRHRFAGGSPAGIAHRGGVRLTGMMRGWRRRTVACPMRRRRVMTARKVLANRIAPKSLVAQGTVRPAFRPPARLPASEMAVRGRRAPAAWLLVTALLFFSGVGAWQPRRSRRHCLPEALTRRAAPALQSQRALPLRPPRALPASPPRAGAATVPPGARPSQLTARKPSEVLPASAPHEAPAARTRARRPVCHLRRRV